MLGSLFDQVGKLALGPGTGTIIQGSPASFGGAVVADIPSAWIEQEP